MNELSLFTGAGGGVLGTKLLGWTTIGYVEFNDYCQKVLSQRIKDSILDEAPIFGDIRAFISEGYASSYTGMVDVITAGFPCQPFSVAGKQQGENDPRNMWPQTIECIRIIRPRFALLENVPGLLAHPYVRRIFGDLAESGYDARWRVLSAAEVGAPHKRDRVFIVAYAKEYGDRQEQNSPWSERVQYHCGGRAGMGGESCNSRTNVAYAESRENLGRERRYMDETATGGESIYSAIEFGSQDVSDPDLRRCGQLDIAAKPMGEKQPPRTSFEKRRNPRWSVEPDVGRVAHVVASRVDRLKALGNGQVSRVVATAWEFFSADLKI